jgi:ABC-type Co2+ transport system permease subunit
MEVIGFGNLIFYLSFALMGGVLALVGTGISIGKLRGNNNERKWAKFGLVLNISVVLFWAYILSVDIRPNQSLHPIAPRKSGHTNQ